MASATPYLTPKRFALGGYGIDISSMTQPALAATLRRATTMVNTYCNGSMLPSPFDFRGGTVTGEHHIFPIPDPLVAYAGSRRVFVNQRPLRSVTRFAIQFTNTYEITLTLPGDVYTNTDQGWCEIVASQPTIIGFPPIGYWYGLYQPIAVVDYTYGYQISVTGDECEAASATLYYATFGQWDATATPEVSLDGVVQVGGYTVNKADGSISFTDAPSPNVTVTASYVTTLPDAIAQATGLIATDLIAQSRIAARGMIGLQSLKVAEVAITQMQPGVGRVTRNGVSIPESAAVFLDSFAHGSAA